MLEYVHAPEQNTLAYLKPLSVPIGIRNKGDLPVLIEEISLVFAHEAGASEDLTTVTHQCGCEIPANGGLEYDSILVCPSLVWQPNTNVFRIVVTCREKAETGLGPSNRITLPSRPYLMIVDAPNFNGTKGREASVFVSFKDSEDLALAEIASKLLRRAGFTPYLAREDERPGSTYWDDKIEPAIKGAEGTLVIWTSNTVLDPGPVLRELRYSQSVGTSVGLFREQGAPLPDEYPGDQKEFGGPFQRDRALVEFAREIEACARRWRSGSGLFS